MSTPMFAKTHNLVAFLEKPTEGEGFKQIVDFLNANMIKIALTVNPTIYTSCIEQFWTFVKVKTIKEEVRILALVDGKKGIINEASIRSNLRLDDAEGTACLPNDTIFEELARMGAKTTAWNEFSSTMASAIICLVNNQKFNFSKYIFESMLKNLDGGVKFLMYPRFVQVFINQQLGDVTHHKKIFVNPSHTKKIFANMKREGKGFSRAITPLFDTMMVQATEDLASRVESYEDKDSLGHQEDASKQGRMINNIDQDEEIELVNETHRRMDDQDMFDVNADLQGDEIVTDEQVVSAAANVEVTTVSTPTTTINEMTLAQTLIEIRAAKPKAITTAATTVTTVVTRPKAKGVVIQWPREATTPTTKPSISSKDKGKGIMVEDPLLMKKKDQIKFDEEVARELEAKLKAKMEKEDRAARLKEEEANTALIESWENTQAMMEVDYKLAKSLQAQEQDELTIEEKPKLFVELMKKRKKHFAELRA
ncbi:hypothetical protein Tco_0528787 [Tanacetum coccineum]